MTRSRETGDVGYRAYKKNYLINGGFDIWQRGTVGLGPNAYTADRWFQFTGAVVNREETTAFGGKDYIAEIVGSGSNTIGQAIELKGAGFNLVPAGKSLTFSGWIFAPVGQTVQFITVYRDAIASVANQVVDANIASLTVGTGTWQYVTHTWISNAVPNPTNNQYTMLLTFPAAGTSYIGKLQIEEGTSATPFEYVSPQENLAACQRYYEKMYTMFMTAAWDAIANVQTWSTTKRIEPTTVISVPAVGTGGSFSPAGLSNTGVFQNIANSQSSNGYVTGDAEL